METSTKLLTVEECCAQLGIRRTKLFELIGSGEIQSLLIGRSRRIPAGDVDEFIERKLAEAVTE